MRQLAQDGSPVSAAIVSALVSADSSRRSGLRQHEAEHRRPDASATRAVSAQWLTVPSRFAATMQQRQPEASRQVGHVTLSAIGTSSPPAPSTSSTSAASSRRRTSASSRARSIVTPSRRAATDGASGARRR